MSGMRTPTKFVKPLSEAQQLRLKEIHKNDPSARTRMRAHAILLSARGYSIDQIANIYEQDRDRVSLWLDWWGDYEYEGLADDPRSGRPAILAAEELKKKACEIVDQSPRCLKTACQQIEKKLKKIVSRDTLKRVLKKAGYSWKRVRKSLRGLRNEQDFRAAQEHLDQLRKACADVGYDFDLIYFDEAGFSLTPCVPYAWQAPDAPLTLPSQRSARLNVLGFLNLRGDFQSFVVKGKVDTEIVIQCFDAYCAELTKPCLVVLDNAPTHRSEAFESKIKSWEKAGLYLLFLPPYSQKLNLIEILWRKLKYEWLPLSAYESSKDLLEQLESTLKEIGSKYLLSFA